MTLSDNTNCDFYLLIILAMNLLQFFGGIQLAVGGSIADQVTIKTQKSSIRVIINVWHNLFF